MTDSQLLRSRVLAALTHLPGRTLQSVRYWCLKGEAEPTDITAPDFYHGGEVELVLDRGSPVRITWDENAGFSEHFSVRVRNGSEFLPDTLEMFDASKCAAWLPSIGELITDVRVFGLDGVPYVAVLCFPSTNIAVGSAWKTRFGDGDDVFVESFDPHSGAMTGLSQIWPT